MENPKRTAVLVLQRLKRYEFATFNVIADAKTAETVSLAIKNLLDARQEQECPDITVKISKKLGIEILPNPLLISGTFRVLSPKTSPGRKQCEACKGSGCAKCDYAGTTSGESAEEFISKELLGLAEGTGYEFELHGERQGEYRFLLELKEPVKRRIDLKGAMAGINKGGRVLVETLEFGQ